MKGVEVLIGEVRGRECAALYVDGQLDDVLIDGDAPRIGTIYRAKATRPVKGQGGMFFDTPDGPAFLRGAKGISPGEMHLVQVSGYAESGKAIPVTNKVLFKSRYAIVTPGAPGMNISRAIKDEDARLHIRAAAETEAAENSPFGIILRSACAEADADDIADDVDAMLHLAQSVMGDAGSAMDVLSEGEGPHVLAWRDWNGTSARETDLSETIAQACRIETRLGAGSITVEPTRAFVAVDVNTGGDTSPAAGLKTNIAAARMLPRCLRVRGLGGQVVVDFAPMPKKDRKAVESALRVALRSDEVETTMVGWTPMGHFELNRKRARVMLDEALA